MKRNLKVFLLALSAVMLTCLSSCDNEPDLEDIPSAVESTITRTNIKGAKSISYMSSSNSRGYSGPGYYVIFDDGSVEPFGIYNSDGKLQKIEISNIKSVGRVLLIRPNYYDCCKAIGKENGKTSEEADLLEKIFRQLIVDKTTGKIYTLPTDCRDMLLGSGYSIDKQGNIYTIYGDMAGEKLAKLNTSDFTLSITPIIGLATNVKLAENDNIFYWYYMDENAQGVGVILNTGEMHYFNDAAGNVQFLNNECYTLNNGRLSKIVFNNGIPALETVQSTEDQNWQTFLYNPVRKSLLLYNYYLEFNCFDYTPDNLTKVDIPDYMEMRLLCNSIERNGHWYIIDTFYDNNQYFYSLDMNTYKAEQIRVKGLSSIGKIEGYIDSENQDYLFFIKLIRNGDAAEMIYGIDLQGNATIVSENDRTGYTIDLIPLN